MRVILEGCDLVGKSTAVKLLKGMIDIEDRFMPFTESIEPTGVDWARLAAAVDGVEDALVIILVIRDENILLRRLSQRTDADQYDLKCVEYNQQYQKVAAFLNDKPNVAIIEVDGLNKYQKTARIVEAFLRFKDAAPRG